ncbi:YHS domain-containing (seleno)protein [Thiolapillus sp.]
MHHLKIIPLLSTLLLSNAAYAEDPIYTSIFSNSAIGGYDPVAYFTTGKPEKGSKQFKLKYKGANWYFSTAEHRRMFQMNPGKYAPQYGGYCAWAVAHNTTAKGDPLQWTIYRDKLYLNYDRKIQADWAANKDQWIQAADANWPKVLE